MIEKAFKTIKTALEEIRPIFVRKEARTGGHVFVCMLAYMLIKYIWEQVKELGFTQEFIFQTLDKIQYLIYELIEGVEIKKLPDEFQPHQQQILNKLQITLPQKL